MTSPLQHIESEVLQRAKNLELDLSKEDGRSRLMTLISEEIQRWDDDVARGRRTIVVADRELTRERAWRNLVGYGPLTELLADDDVWEIEINSPTEIFVKRHVGSNGYHHETFHDDEHVIRTLTKMLNDSSSSHRKLDPTEGLQDAQLDDGSRVHIVHGDLARGGHLLVNIRKFTGIPYSSLHELTARGTLDSQAAKFLAFAVRGRSSMIFAGAPGSGKTTLLSCCLGELDPSLRVCIAEEVFEVDAPLPNVAGMQTRPARIDRPAIDLRRLVSGFLRMAPDVAIVGEVRDREALPLLLTLSSGVKGFTTIHASSARGALSRLRFLAELSGTATLPHQALISLVSDSVDVVVHSKRTADGPRVMEIVAVEEPIADTGNSFTVTELFTRANPHMPLQWTGLVPSRLTQNLSASGISINEVLR